MAHAVLLIGNDRHQGILYWQLSDHCMWNNGNQIRWQANCSWNISQFTAINYQTVMCYKYRMLAKL